MNNLIRLLCLSGLIVLSQITKAQICNPTYVQGNECTNQGVAFKANAPGFTSYLWEFEDASGTLIATSNDRDPVYAFKSAGTYKVTLMATGGAGNCTKPLTIVIKQSPIPNLIRITPRAQCFNDNRFVFIDSSSAAPGSTLQRVGHLFGDGRKYENLNPSQGDTVSHSVLDPKGGVFNLKLELHDANGCVTEHYIDTAVQVHPRIGVSFYSNAPVRCDSTRACFTNNTYVNWKKKNREYIALKDVAEFTWDFGDGYKVVGDSSTNTDYWKGANDDGVICYTYQSEGSFDAVLSVTSKHGCKASYTFKKAATNVKFDNPRIIASNDSFPASMSTVRFRLEKGPIPGASFLWNFGDPTSGPGNHSNRDWEPNHEYSSLGPKMISLRIVSGPCDVQVYDTVLMYGPLATIERAFDRIDFNEKYQCFTKDTVRFTNNSTFYHNDPTPGNEDSTVIVDGKRRYVFNFNENTRSGDQTPLTSQKHLSNRTMGTQVRRLWDFGDKYALQCTTSTALNLNIGKNCNYSLDEKPKHIYPNWDTVYYNDHYLTNDTLTYFYFDSAYYCHSAEIDTTDPALHRKLFMEKYMQNFTARLYLDDTVALASDEDEVLIVTTKPDASRMTLESGITCPFDGNKTQYYLEFDLNTGSQSYFAVNYDSAQGKDKFVAFNSGSVSAPPAPGSPIPFTLPYDITGTYGDRFVKVYTSGELGGDWSKGPRRDITLGVVVANGPLDFNGQPLGCTDTAWYSNALTFNRMDATFDIIGNKEAICKGGDIYLKLKNEDQFGLQTLRINNGYQDRLSGYYEDFHYLEEYNGPVVGRNDADVKYSGEDWRYNYVVRHTLDDLYGDVTLDTIVTAIVKDWETTYERPDIITLDNYFKNIGYLSFNPLQDRSWQKALGRCIDTTGLDLKPIRTEYYDQDANVVRHGNKRYRYINEKQTDSIEVAEILHFRAYSLQGFDTLIDGTDTIPGVWKISYNHPEIHLDPNDPTKKDTVIIQSKGPMTPGIYLNNRDGCQRTNARLVNVGYINHVKLVQDAVCHKQTAELYDSVRYWQLGDDAYPWFYPIDPRKFWEDPVRFANGTLETKSVDWDSTDGLNPKRNITFYHQYDEPGEYVATFITKDSIGCMDTAYVNINATGVRANFRVEQSNDQCNPTIQFYDSSKMLYAKDGVDSVTWYEWSFDDGSPRSILKDPTHSYRNYGWYRIKLKALTVLGCEDSVEKQVFLPGPQPSFDFAQNAQWNVTDTAIIYEGDILELRNLSKTPQINPSFVMNWGDGTISNVTGPSFKHTYNDSGVYNLYLTMEDEVPGSPAVCARIYPDSTPDSWVSIIHEVVVVRKDTSGSISELQRKARIYPNPSNGVLHIETDNDLTIKSIQVLDAIGREVLISHEGKQANETQILIQHPVTGYYTVKIETNKGFITRKISLIQP